MRILAHIVDFGAPGRIRLLDLVDGEDGILGVVSIQMLIERHSDGGDFLAGVMLRMFVTGNSGRSDALSVHLVGTVNLFADFADEHEAEAEHEKRAEYYAHGYCSHNEAVGVLLLECLDFIV